MAKPSNHDTNLVDAQLVITRGADGRHRIGQITYKSEEDILNQQPVCRHHHYQSPPTTKIKSTRATGRLTPSSVYSKQSSPSTDQDYSSLTETTPSKPSSSSSLDFKDESPEQPIKSLNITPLENRHYLSVTKYQTEPRLSINSHPIIESTKPYFNENRSSITESIIGNIDGNIHPTSIESERDFDIADIEDAMEAKKKFNDDKDTAANIDNDSLESSEGVLEEKKKLPPTSTRKSGGYSSALYLAQKQKFQQEQVANRKRLVSNATNRYSSRSNTLPNVVEAVKNEEQLNKPRRKPMVATQRSQSSDLVDKINDTSKLDRDSGFDEQDFRRERLHSIGDDNSSISSIRSAKSATNLEYKETKSYELRMKKLAAKRNLTEKDLSLKSRQNMNSSSRRGSDMIPPIPPTRKYRKNSQPVLNLKQQ